jgi:tetratricopeptide (TPR) repeat protein
MTSRASFGAGAVCLALSCALAAPAVAQNVIEAEITGFEATLQEREAWMLTETQKYVGARELAEKILAANPKSFVAHLVLGQVQHFGESNLPRALFHLDQARALFEARFGDQPTPDLPWRWHATMLRALSSVHGDMEHHAEKLAYIARFNELYEPDMLAERAWPLMKLGRLTEARVAAELGLATERPVQRTLALNALCAVEFEAGNDGASYAACKRAVDEGAALDGQPSAVDLTNFAEASRSLFKLDEAERVALEATNAEPSWYGNPWMELGELFVRQGRFAEAVSALKRVPEYRKRRPPHVRDADRNEMQRVIASLLLVLARPEEAFALTERALTRPDRRAHNSRDPDQDRTVLALLDRRARLVAAELVLEEAAGQSWYRRPLAWLKAAWLRFDASRSGALALRLLSDEKRLIGMCHVGAASSAVTPPWLLGEIVDVVGSGVATEVLQRARAADARPGAPAYYDALAAEAAWRGGDDAQARKLATRALSALAPGEALLRARVNAVAAEAARAEGDGNAAVRHYDAALQADPGVFRRLGVALPIEIVASSDEVAQAAASVIARSPRFTVESSGLSVRIEANRTSGRACLGSKGQLVGCADVKAKATEDADELGARIATAMMEEVFAPRVDLTQADVGSLDGGNLVGRDALKTLFE